MFDLKEQAGDDAGYELRVGYSRAHDQFYVKGYIIFLGKHGLHEYERDGATLWFPTIDDALKHITQYPEPNPNQLLFDYEVEQ